MFDVVWKYILAAALAGACTLAIANALPSLISAPGIAGAAARISVNSLLFAAMYLGVAMLLHSGFGPLYQIKGLFREMISTSNHQAPLAVSEDAICLSER
jgi:Na+-translocating ferredoxin:NAD+ oxidoreductase RnfE subunit